MHSQLVFGRGQVRVVGLWAILAQIDLALPVLDPDPHGKRLGGQGNIALLQHLHRVAGTVADRQDNLRGRPGFRLVSSCCSQAADGQPKRRGSCGILLQVIQPGAERKCPAQLFDGVADRCDDPTEQIGADMRFLFDQDLRWRTCQDELFQHGTAARIVQVGRQLAIGKSPGSAFTKLDIILRVQRAAGPETVHRLLAAGDRLATLNDPRPESGPGQSQCRKQASRTAADNHRPAAVGHVQGQAWVLLLCKTKCGDGHQARQLGRGLVPDHGILDPDITLAPGIDGAADDRPGAQTSGRTMEGPGDRPGQIVR